MHFNNFSRKQEQVLCWWLPESPHHKKDAIICDGAVRSGKTLCMSLSFILWAMSNFDGVLFAICGKTITSCERNVLTPLQEVIKKNLGMQCHYSRSLGYMTVTGSESTNRFYIFGGKDEGSAALIQGVTLAGLLLDEVALMPKSFVDQAMARCSVFGSKFWFNCNPEGPQHWFYLDWVQKAEMKRALYIHFTMRDNPSLAPSIRQRYESLYDGVFYLRYIQGKWVAAEGLVYSMFNVEKHVLPVNKMPHNVRTAKQVAAKVSPYEKYWISIDYGTMNPCVFLFWGKKNGVYYLVKEYYYDGRKDMPRTDAEHYQALVEFADGFAIDHVIVDPSAASFVTLIQRCRRFRVRAADNAVLDGIRETGTALKREQIKISAACVQTIAEFGLYTWDAKASEDKVVKESDHAMDAIRYFVKTLRVAVPTSR